MNKLLSLGFLGLSSFFSTVTAKETSTENELSCTPRDNVICILGSPQNDASGLLVLAASKDDLVGTELELNASPVDGIPEYYDISTCAAGVLLVSVTYYEHSLDDEKYWEARLIAKIDYTGSKALVHYGSGDC